MSSERELHGYPWRRDDDVRMLREFDRISVELNNALMSTNLTISRAEDDLIRGVERKNRILGRLETVQTSSHELYWHRLLTWITTGRLV